MTLGESLEQVVNLRNLLLQEVVGDNDLTRFKRGLDNFTEARSIGGYYT